MGPQLYRCGNSSLSMPYKAIKSRFNGAATLSLRKLIYGVRHSSRTVALQWGRNFIVAETPLTATLGQVPGRSFNGAATLSLRKPSGARYATSLLPGLQWGRNFIVAETRPGAHESAKVCNASMGPQLYRCGNERDVVGAARQAVASMGPQLYRCGNHITRRRHSAAQ